MGSLRYLGILAGLLAAGCNMSGDKEYLEENGYTQVEMNGPSFNFRCGPGLRQGMHESFTAVSKGKKVTGSLCHTMFGKMIMED